MDLNNREKRFLKTLLITNIRSIELRLKKIKEEIEQKHDVLRHNEYYKIHCESILRKLTDPREFIKKEILEDIVDKTNKEMLAIDKSPK